MLLRETQLLSFHKNQWILDLRFRNKANQYGLSGFELMFLRLVERCGIGLANTLSTSALQKKDRINRVLLGPLYKINSLPYISYGFGCGHIGYFMDEFPDYPIKDACPYHPQASYMDDVNSLYLSQAFTEPKPGRAYVYHWKSVPYWLGDDATDVGLHVFERRSQTPIPLEFIQSALL